MNILFDNIIYSKEKQGGISNYWTQIIQSFKDDNNVFFYEEKNASDNIFRKQMKLTNIVEHSNLSLPLSRLLPITFPGPAEKLLYHSSFYRQLRSKSPVVEITTVHDFLHNKHASLLKRIFHNKLKYGAIKRAGGIICVSHSTMNDLKKYCRPKASQKLAMIYNGVSDDYKPSESNEEEKKLLQKYKTGEKFLLFVGARSSYKNFDFVITLLEQLPNYKLVIVGNALSQKEKNSISERTLNRITVAQSIGNKELNVFYNHAHALLYPSYYEGFGIPVVEAMKAGCPVLALNTTSIPEISGGAAKLFNDLDTYQFVQEISQLENLDYRSEVISLGLINATRFSWSKCVEQTRDFYKEVFSS